MTHAVKTRWGRRLRPLLAGVVLGACLLGGGTAHALTRMEVATCDGLATFVERRTQDRDAGVPLAQADAANQQWGGTHGIDDTTRLAWGRLLSAVYAHPELPPAEARHLFLGWCLTIQPMGSDPLGVGDFQPFPHKMVPKLPAPTRRLW